jgi:hypothetical protein
LAAAASGGRRDQRCEREAEQPAARADHGVTLTGTTIDCDDP